MKKILIEVNIDGDGNVTLSNATPADAPIEVVATSTEAEAPVVATSTEVEAPVEVPAETPPAEVITATTEALASETPAS